jgi:hypothetical protein
MWMKLYLNAKAAKLAKNAKKTNLKPFASFAISALKLFPAGQRQVDYITAQVKIRTNPN